MARDGSFKYTIHDEFDKIFDEKGNTFMALRKISWNESEKVNLDMRRWYINADGDETIGKGTSFITEEGPHNLADLLVEEGFGHTQEILKSLQKREDFQFSVKRVLNGSLEEIADSADDEEFYDPASFIAG